jgi:ABC-type lipoprotein release transport system permease subunit
MVAAEEVTKGSMVIGIDPDLERTHTHLNERVVEGVYLEKNDNGILVGKGLADYLEVGVNDTLVLLGAGYQGMTAVGKYPVRGIVKFGSPELSSRLIFLPMGEAHVFFGTYGMITSVVLKTSNSNKGVKGASKLGKTLSDDYEVMNWMELNPSLVNMIKTDRTEGYVFMFILYMVILFGVFGTMLMMLAERRREFGVLVAVGMKRAKLAFMVWIEIIIMAVLGSLIGIIGAFPTCYYLYANPIQYSEEMAKMAEEYGMEAVLKASLAPEIFIQQAIVVALIASVAAIYPLFKLQRLNAVEEMRS